MAQPNAPVPPTPSPADPKAAAPSRADVDIKSVDPEKPAEGSDVKAPEAKKPANQLEAELQAQFGDEWEALPQKAKERIIASEMKSREADKRMQLAAKLKKDLDMTNAQVGQLIEHLKKDPWKVLSNPALGHDVRKLAEEYVWQMIQEQRMTPEQREAMQFKAEAAQLRAEKEAREKSERETQEQQKIAERRAYWEKTIQESIETEKLPNTSYVVRRFADYIKASVRQRIPADMPGIAKQIRQELIDLQSKFLLPPKFQSESDDAYEERILSGAPNEYVKLLRKADLRKLRAKGTLPKPGPKPGNSSQPAPSKKISMSQWLNERDQRLGRK
jgi:biotin operon repressor